MVTPTPTPNQPRTLNIQQAMVLATQLHGGGKLADAERIINSILQINPGYPPALHLLGVIAHQVGKKALAIELIERALAGNDKVALFHANIGEMYRQSGNLTAAIEHGEQAVSLDPNMATGYANLGIAYYDLKQFDKAEACQKRALELNPNSTTALNNMGSIHKEHKRNKEAIEFYEKAIAISTNYAEPHNNLGAVLVTEQMFAKAIDFLSKALALSPDFADAHCNLGFALNGLDFFDRALVHFNRALELKPNYPEAYIGLGKIHRGKQNFDEAVKATLKALEINDTKPEFYDSLGSIYVEMGEPEKAMAYFDIALSMNPDISSALLSKGNLLVELGQVDKAEQLLLKAREDNSTNSRLSANFGIVQLRKVKKTDQSMKELLEAYEHIEDLAPNQVEYLHFALGKCFDDTKQHELAFKHYTAGCELKRKRINYDPEQQTIYFDNLISIFNKEKIESLRKFSNSSDLPIFVLGMPRSGTTLTEQIIASHPKVFGAGELRHLVDLVNHSVSIPNGQLFYPLNFNLLTDEQITHIGNEYIERLRTYSSDAPHITDKMPGNFTNVGVIHALLPNAKIIHVVRNPFDNCLSCYTRLFQYGQNFTYDLAELGRYYGDYRRLMQHWRNVLPKDAFLDVIYEDLVTDTETQAKRIIDFCGLEWDANCLEFHKMERQVRTASVTQVRQPIYTTSVDRWKRFEKELQPIAIALGDKMK